MDAYILKLRQAMSLGDKIRYTKRRLNEWIEYFGTDGVYISFSGGKDSTVLLSIAREMYPELEAVFVDTGLEYPEIRQFVKSFDNVIILRPAMRFDEVIRNYGYPVISKEVSEAVYNARLYLKDGKKYKTFYEKLTGTLKNPHTGEQSRYNCPQWKFLLDAPFKISHKCCFVMKKTPAHEYYRKTGKKPIIATMAEESHLRTVNYLRFGCNAFKSTIPTSTPIAFWTEQDVLEYIQRFGLKYAPVYGDLIRGADGKLRFTGCKRTGCMFCGFGCHLEKEPNRFQQLKKTHPAQWEYIMHKLGMAEVLNFLKINYDTPQLSLF